MKRVLIVDDSTFTRNIHKQIITSVGYQTLEAANGAEAIETFEKEKPDLVIIDLLMPDMDGMDAVSKILEKDADAKVIVCSTDKQKYRKEQASELGVQGFLTKPVNAEKFRETVQDLFENSRR